MRRIGLLTLAASAAVAAVPSAAPAAHPCVSSPGVATCETLVSENPTVGSRYVYLRELAKDPGSIIVCVRECGPPTG